MEYVLWLIVTKSPQTNQGNQKTYGFSGSMGYTWYGLFGSLLYYPFAT